MRGAGGGRPSKPANERRHRNPPTKDTIIVYADDRVANIPEPILPFEGQRRELWVQMWAQPVAVLWDPVDVAPLSRMVMLQTSATTFIDSRLLIELRQLEDRFLLNPYARAQQRVVIERRDEEAVRAATAVPAPVSSLEKRRALAQRKVAE